MMDKERELILESGFSEKQLDLQVDKTKSSNQVKAVNIFDASKKEKEKKS